MKRSRLSMRLLSVVFIFFCTLVTVAAPSVNAPLQPDAKMRTETLYFLRFLQELHYNSKPIKDIPSKEILVNYIKSLDFNRSFFTQEEVDAFLERYQNSMDLLLEAGSLSPAFEIYYAYKRDIEERIKWVSERLKKPFDFTKKDTFSPDRQKADFPKNKAAENELWEKRLKYELLNEVLGIEKYETDVQKISDKTLDEAKQNILKRYETLGKNLGNIDATDVQELFLNSLSHLYDPHSSFFSLDSMEDFAIALKNSLVGIGAYLASKDGYCTVNEIFPGSPCEKSKSVFPGDKILAVGQDEEPMVDIVGMKLTKAVKMIRGHKGTTVRLLIQPANGDPSDRKVVKIVRDEIKITENLAQARIYQVPVDKKTVSVGVIDLPSFYGSDSTDAHDSNTSGDVKELLLKLKSMHVKGVILDFRFNGGGLLEEAIELTGLFIPRGPVVQVRDMQGHIQTYMDKDNHVVWKGPLMVLVSRFSASAAEIVAGALQSHGRALIVGDPSTHGKGTVQAVIEMDRLSFFPRKDPYLGAAKITIQKWYLPDGRSTQKRGVESDISFPSFNQYLPIGESDLPHALKWDAIDPLPWNYRLAQNNYDAIYPQLKRTLSSKSQTRQSSLKEFALLKERIQRFRDKQEQKNISLSFKQRQKTRKRDKAFIDEAEKQIRELAKQNYAYEDVLLDVAKDKKAKSTSENLLFSNPDLSAGSKETEKLPQFDVYMREALRIMADWIEMKESRKVSYKEK